ncbi:MAG TPA: VanZ family protein [Halobacteriales archaeon]|nr:VanZ family protein [Halobacteriales archaeon]
MSARSRRRHRRWRGTAATALLLLVGSAVPLPPRHNPDFGPFGPDKFLHLVGHAGFATALAAALGDGSSGRVAVATVVASTAYGLSTELLQESIPGREFERADVVAGLFGSILGVFGWRRLTDGSSVS